MIGWHFLRADNRLGFNDGRQVFVGETITVEGRPVLCDHGLHASKHIIDALQYAPGPVCCLVDLIGDVVNDDDKFVGRSRKTLWMADISELLHLFACDVAEEALKKRCEAGNKTDPRLIAAIEAKRRWLKGEISDQELAAARDAAWDAAWTAAWDAARDAAWDAAWTAARAAARDAARIAARAATWDAARAATWDAARIAARAAAWTAAWTATWDAQNIDIESRIKALPGFPLEVGK